MAEERLATLVRLLDSTWSEEGWHPPMLAAVEGLSAAQAAWRAAPGALTAWQFVSHVAFWKESAARRLTGQPRLPGEDDNDATFGAPGDGADEADWRAAVARLKSAHATLRERAAGLTDTDLADPEREALVLGVATHDAYHGAEIVQLRKLQGAWPVSR